MEYTQSPDFAIHGGTGQRMHTDTAPITTAVTANDENMVIWSLMEIVKAAGLTGIAFDPNNPASYQRLRDSLNAVYAKLASPALTGLPTAPTAAPGTNTNQVSTTAFVQAAVAALVDSSPAALDTLKELSTALGNDANFATTVTAAVAAKAALADFQNLLTGNGYQRLPNGTIVQWAAATLPTGNGDVLTLPLAFPNAILRILATDYGSGCNACGWAPNGSSKSTFLAYGKVAGSNIYGSTAFNYLAIGH